MEYLGAIASIVGFGVSLYIFRTEHKKKPLMCPRKAPCEAVIGSAYSRTFGIPNTILGMLYYTLFLGLLIVATTGHFGLMAALPFVALIGVVFSAYLIGVQAFVLRAWCVWCLLSALSSILVYVSALILLNY